MSYMWDSSSTIPYSLLCITQIISNRGDKGMVPGFDDYQNY
jgi:hypothetical protein